MAQGGPTVDEGEGCIARRAELRCKGYASSMGTRMKAFCLEVQMETCQEVLQAHAWEDVHIVPTFKGLDQQLQELGVVQGGMEAGTG